MTRGLRELDGSIVIDLGYRVWTRELCSFEFLVGVFSNHYLISGMVGVVTLLGVFFLVVLKNAVLLPFLYVLPVCLERHVEEGITSEHELCWRGSCCGVYYTADGLSDRAEDSFPFEVFVEIILSSDISCAEHVSDHLVDTLYYGIRLGIPGGNDLLFNTKFVL